MVFCLSLCTWRYLVPELLESRLHFTFLARSVGIMGAHCHIWLQDKQGHHACHASAFPVSLSPVPSLWQIPVHRPCSMKSCTCFQDLPCTWPGKLCLFTNSLTLPKSTSACYSCKSKHFLFVSTWKPRYCFFFPWLLTKLNIFSSKCACVYVCVCLFWCILSRLPFFFYQGAHPVFPNL